MCRICGTAGLSKKIMPFAFCNKEANCIHRCDKHFGNEMNEYSFREEAGERIMDFETLQWKRNWKCVKAAFNGYSELFTGSNAPMLWLARCPWRKKWFDLKNKFCRGLFKFEARMLSARNGSLADLMMRPHIDNELERSKGYVWKLENLIKSCAFPFKCAMRDPRRLQIKSAFSFFCFASSIQRRKKRMDMLLDCFLQSSILQ